MSFRYLKPVIDRVQHILHYEEACMKLELPLDVAFPYLEDAKARIGSQFAGPMEVARACVRWIWIGTHAGLAADRIRAVASQISERSLAASERSAGNYLRPDHDVFLMMAVVLSGDSTAMEKVASVVQPAAPQLEGYQFLQAWTGILRARVLGNQAEEMRQLDVLLRKKAASTYQSPSHSLTEAFCRRDYPAMNKCLRKAFVKERASLAKEGSIITNEQGDEIVIIEGRSLNHYWPWAEASFAKLAYIDGAQIESDALWLPTELLRM